MTRTPPHLSVGVPAGYEDFVLERRHRVCTQLAPPEGATLLDFGCGNGAQTQCFAGEFRRILGVDVTEASLREFARVRSVPHLHPVLYDGYRLPLDDESVDRATSFEVLEHVEDELSALREIHRVLAPGAKLLISVPNRWWIFETHGADLPGLPWNRVPGFSWLPSSIHDRFARARIYRRRDLVRILRIAGFSVERTVRITAPMDVARPAALRRALRATLFRSDTTSVPFLATSILAVAKKPMQKGQTARRTD